MSVAFHSVHFNNTFTLLPSPRLHQEKKKNPQRTVNEKKTPRMLEYVNVATGRV